jgi:type II secretory pathway pseudopilin PulG
MSRPTPSQPPGQAGFSLIELITVFGIIFIMAGVMVPPLAGYVKAYRIRGATQQVASAINATRMKAISKNANLGVTFVTLNGTDFRVVVEDDLDPAVPNWKTIASENWPVILTLPAQTGAVELLPSGIQFDNPANCPAPTGGVVAGAATDWGLRFTRLGAGCALTATGCGGLPGSAPAYTSYINFNPATSLATVCLWQPQTNIRRWVNVSTGGRVRTQP